MLYKKSLLNGRLENEVDNFVATLENEFGYDVKLVSVLYIDNNGDEVLHSFSVSCCEDSNKVKEYEVLMTFDEMLGDCL